MGPWKPAGEGYKIKYNPSVSKVRVRIPKGGGPTDYRTGVVEDVVAKPAPKPKPRQLTLKQKIERRKAAMRRAGVEVD